MVRTANFMDGDVEELSEKITTARKLLEHMESSLSGCYSDVEALLFYDKPLTAACEQIKENGGSMWDGLIEYFDRFVLDTKQHIGEILAQWDALPLDEMERAENYRAMVQQITSYQQEEEPRLIQREYWQSEYDDNLTKDYENCQEYLKRYEEIRGKPNSEYEAVITILYRHMKAFDRFTDEQIHAMGQMEEPLTTTYLSLACFADKATDRETLDRIILGMANARTKILAHKQKMQEQIDELER
jgi:hypothetical protein